MWRRRSVIRENPRPQLSQENIFLGSGPGFLVLDRETSTIFTRRKEDSCSEIVDTFDGRNDNGDDPGPRMPVGDLSGYSFECWVQSWQNLLGVISVHYQN